MTTNIITMTTFHKITKIVRALSLTERRVCMRVCKQVVTSRCFAFRALIGLFALVDHVINFR